jgi:hypothetical protein
MRYWIASFTTLIASSSRATACAAANRTRTRPRSGRAIARSTGLHPSRGGGFLANERHHGVEPRPLVRPPKPQSGVHG